jgi:hypothetical protein
MPDAKSNRHRDRMNGQGCERFMDELLPHCLSLGCFGASRTVGQFDHRDDRNRDVGISGCAGDGGEHLPRVLSLPLGL